MTPDERRERWTRSFARGLAATIDADPVTRECIEQLARRLDVGHLTPSEQRSVAEQLDELLLGEIERRHR